MCIYIHIFMYREREKTQQPKAVECESLEGGGRYHHFDPLLQAMRMVPKTLEPFLLPCLPFCLPLCFSPPVPPCVCYFVAYFVSNFVPHFVSHCISNCVSHFVARFVWNFVGHCVSLCVCRPNMDATRDPSHLELGILTAVGLQSWVNL